MITKNQIRFVKSLQQKKCRNENNLFVVEGAKNIHELIESKFVIENLYCSKTSELPSQLISYDEISSKDMERMSGMKTPPGILAVVKLPENNWDESTHGITIILDGLKDPGNMGTIIRTAEWFDVQRIICSEESVELWNPKVVQATMGAIFRIPVYYNNLSDVLQVFNNNKVATYTTVLEGENIYKTKFDENAGIIIGSESHGISNEIINKSDHKITIPSFGKSESLNASIACSIVISEIRSGK